MLGPFNLLLITAVLCLVMLLVLSSLARSATPGVREWVLANAAAFIALLLFAGRGTLPDLISIEVANGMLAGAIALVYIGLRRFFQLDVPSRVLAAGWGLMLAGVMFFHYAIDSIPARIVVVSVFHGTISLLIGATIVRVKSVRLRYPYLFTACIAFLFGAGHFIRGAVYLTGSDTLTSTLQASGWNLIFLSIGTLVLPIYGMGAVMMAHDRMMTRALDDANHDFLTSLWTRRALFEFAERELARSRRTHRKLSLLVFDVDHFKQLNDSFGHAAGDQVLIAIAKCTLQQVRAMDYVARIGGEEFAILLPEVDEPTAFNIAERLRRTLHEHNYPEVKKISAGAPITVSVSIGIATAEDNETISELLNRADKALYQAKAAGRNLVRQAEVGMLIPPSEKTYEQQF